VAENMLDTLGTEQCAVILIEHTTVTSAHLSSLSNLVLNYLKTKIVSTLAVRSRAFAFNVGRYGKDVHFWQEEPVTCSETAVRKAGEWLREADWASLSMGANLNGGPNAPNLLGALLGALNQPRVDAVFVAAASADGVRASKDMVEQAK